MSMKSFRGKRWTLQLYWPDLFLGPSTFGIKFDFAIVFTRYNTGARSGGFEILGFGFGLLRDTKGTP